jgi:hypothetical protein
LVIELQAIGIVLILENSCELVGVALELDGHSHLATWIPPSHFLLASTNPACRRRRTNPVEKLLRLPLETETPTPTLILLLVEHTVPLSRLLQIRGRYPVSRQIPGIGLAACGIDQTEAAGSVKND